MKKLLTLSAGVFLFLYGMPQTVTITLKDSVTYQEIVGFGAHGAMNPWWESNFYNSTFLDRIVDDLGLTVTRNEFYDYDMSYYNNKQKPFYIALKNKAAGSNEPIKFIHTVWSPQPQWKANNDVTQGTDPSKNYLLPQYYDDYANFCADYIATTLKNDCGIDLYAFSLQNEPAFNETYQSCKYTPQQYNDLLKVAGPIFRSKCPNVKLFGPEDMGSAATTGSWTNVIFNDPVSVNYLDVLAVHGYTDGVNASTGDAPGWTAMYNIAASKKKQLWMTETSGYSDSWTASPGAFDLGKAIYLALKYGKVSAWVWWQLGGAGSEYELMGNNDGSPTKRYYVSKNYYRYIRPGAVQIESSSPDNSVYVVAFKHSGNSSYSAVKPQVTVVLLNTSTSSKTVKLTGRNIPSTMQAYRTSATENCVSVGSVNTSGISLLGQTITTLVYQGTNKGPTVNTPADVVIVKNTAKTVSLTGVTAGQGETGTVTVTAEAMDKSLIPSVSVTGSAPNYTLSFTPATDKTGSTVIRVYVKDNGSDMLNMTVVSFNVKVIAQVNKAPTIDPIKNYTVGLNNKTTKHYIWFTGVTDGNDGTQNIYKPVLTLSNPSCLRLPYVNYTPNNSYGNIEFYPDKLGSTEVEVKVQDDGGTDLGGVDTKTIKFTITVVDNAPLLGIEGNIEEPMIIYPNPSGGIVTIELPGNYYKTITVMDVNGREWIKQQITTNVVEIDMSDMPNGMYFVVARGEKIIKGKVIIDR